MLVSLEVRAQEEGFEAGLRTGYGLPLGKATDSATRDMNQANSGILPVWVEAGYRLTANALFGVYFQYGFGFIGEELRESCDARQVDCSTSSTRVGGQFHYHVTPEGAADLWLGFGIGYEWWSLAVEDRWSLTVEGPTGKFESVTSGFEFGNFQLGVDFHPAPHFYVGPFFSFSLDEFNSVDASCSGTAAPACAAVDGSIEQKAFHHWLLLGVRIGFTGYAG